MDTTHPVGSARRWVSVPSTNVIRIRPLQEPRNRSHGDNSTDTPQTVGNLAWRKERGLMTWRDYADQVAE